MNIEVEIKPDLKLISSHRIVKVLQNKTTGQKSLHANRPFHPGKVICSFAAEETFREPNYLTIQIGRDKHITLLPSFLQYTNHSCAPTVFFDIARMQLICLRELCPGDELTFFYPGTEWEMAQPFTCHCGSPDCLQLIQGAAHLPSEVLEKYVLSDFIRASIHR